MSDSGQKYDVSHPFDREEEVSLQQLFTAFCNHLTLGQWELARVCLRGLFDKRHQLNKPLKEILRAIIDQPQNARLVVLAFNKCDQTFTLIIGIELNLHAKFSNLCLALCSTQTVVRLTCSISNYKIQGRCGPPQLLFKNLL